jgi:hypothetical protein
LLLRAVPYCYLPGKIFPLVASARRGVGIPAMLLHATPLFSAPGPKIYISSQLLEMEIGVHSETYLVGAHLTDGAASRQPGKRPRARVTLVKRDFWC